MKKYLIIILLGVLFVVSCRRVELARPGTGNCELRISLETDIFKTKAVTPGNGEIWDGGGVYIDNTDPGNPIPDLVILIFDSNGDIAACYPGTNSTLEENPDETEMSVVFTSLDEGTYTVYAFANTEGYWSMVGQGGMTPKNYLLSLTTAGAVEALQFSDLFASIPASVCPYDQDDVENHVFDRLPLSAKGTARVSSLHAGAVSLELLRCVAKVSCEFINNTGAELTLYDFSNTLDGICPNSGYVVLHETDFPSGALSGNIIASESSLTIPAWNDPDTRLELGSITRYWYVFPSTGPYSCDVTFTMFKGEAGERTYTYSDLPVHDDHAVSIPSLPRNRHLHIVTKISKGTSVSFNFEVSGWGSPIEENVLFD